MKGVYYLLLVATVLVHYTYASSYGQQNKITFPNMPQAQKLWDEKDILGDSTFFAHPVSLGTFSNCDDIQIEKVFDDNFEFLVNYTLNGKSTSEFVYDLSYLNPAVRVVTGASYRQAKAQRTIENRILSAEGCVMACVTEKDFTCRDCDYFVSDGGKCALYSTTGYVYSEDEEDTNHPLYVGDNSASNHYIIYKRGESPTPCNVTDGEYAHSYYALGWKAMETGWYTLAHQLLDEAIRIDPDFHMAYVGKMLSNENMGYGMGDIDSYKERMQRILNAADFEVKLSLQEQLLVKALSALQDGADFNDGLGKMLEVFKKYRGYKDNILKVVEGNANLLRLNSYQGLNKLADEEQNVFALQLLTHNLNPYENGKSLISEESHQAATDAVYHYQKLGIKGAWQITADCTDISEYYSRWQLGKFLLENQRTFLFENTNPRNASFLLGEEEDDLIVHGLGVKYMSKSLLRVSDYERLHFFELQLGLFNLAKDHLNHRNLLKDDEHWQMLKHRMTANAFFSTYDYIYNKYAKEIQFDEDWTIPGNASTNDLALASRAYYWTAAAVQKLTDKNSVDDIKTALDSAIALTQGSYATLIELYKTVVMGTEELLIRENYEAAHASAQHAAALQEKLVAANDFTIDGNEDSKQFRMLIPLGYQFEADMLSSLIQNEDAKASLKDSITLDDVIVAYERAVNTPPLNVSRILRGYGYSLYQRDENAPRQKNTPNPNYVYAFEELERTWARNDIEGHFAALADSQLAVELYYDKPESGCAKGVFQIISKGDGKLCWGGAIIIGVACGIVVIIIIIIGILCLRRKAKAPRKTKEKGAFIFSGPNLSSQDNFGSSSHIGLGTLNRGSPDDTPYASQTLGIQRPFHDSDYTQRSNTIGGVGKTGDFEAYSSH